MHRLLLAGAILTAVSLTGCCRMCCWQHGGSWSGGGCCLPQAPVVQPTGAPVILPQQQTYAPATTYLPPTNPCTCN